MKTVVAGTRTATWESTIAAIRASGVESKITEVVSGRAKGADTWGEVWAVTEKKRIKAFPADWDQYGNRAGFIRNEQMAEYGDVLIAVWDGNSSGTRHMIQSMLNKGKQVFVYVYGDQDKPVKFEWVYGNQKF